MTTSTTITTKHHTKSIDLKKKKAIIKIHKQTKEQQAKQCQLLKRRKFDEGLKPHVIICFFPLIIRPFLGTKNYFKIYDIYYQWRNDE